MPFAITKRAPDASRVGWSQRFTVCKYDATAGLAFGWASCAVDKSGRLIIDHDEDTIAPAELEKGAYSFVEDSGLIGDMHEKMGVSSLVESVFLDGSKREAMGLAKSDDRSVAWWIGVRVRDQGVKKKLDRGERGEFSIAGEALRIANGDGSYSLCELSIEEVSHVDKGAGIGVAVALYKHRRKDLSNMNFAKLITACLARVPEKERAALTKKLGDIEKMASMEDIKSKLTAEEWDLILTHLTPGEAPGGTANPDAPDAVAAAPAAQKNRKTKKVAKGRKVAKSDDDEDEDDGADDDEPTEASEIVKLSKVLEKQATEIAELKKREKLEKYRKEAEKVAKFYPASMEEVAKMLLAADEHEDKVFGKSQRDAIVRASAAIEKSGLFATHGTGRSEDETGAGKVIGLVAKRLEKSEGKRGDRLKAWEDVAKTSPDAYVEYSRERGIGGVRD